MADKTNPEESADAKPKIVGPPVTVPVEIDPLAYGIGYEVHWERDQEGE